LNISCAIFFEKLIFLMRSLTKWGNYKKMYIFLCCLIFNTVIYSIPNNIRLRRLSCAHGRGFVPVATPDAPPQWERRLSAKEQKRSSPKPYLIWNSVPIVNMFICVKSKNFLHLYAEHQIKRCSFGKKADWRHIRIVKFAVYRRLKLSIR